MGAWALLIVRIVAEVIATSLLKNSNGFAQPLYGILSIVIFAGCPMGAVLRPDPHTGWRRLCDLA